MPGQTRRVLAAVDLGERGEADDEDAHDHPLDARHPLTEERCLGALAGSGRRSIQPVGARVRTPGGFMPPSVWCVRLVVSRVHAPASLNQMQKRPASASTSGRVVPSAGFRPNQRVSENSEGK